MEEFEAYGERFKPISSRYMPYKVLGRGTYGIVVAAHDKQTGASVAVKKVTSMSKTATDGKHTLREIRLMRWLGRHPNIIGLLDAHVSIADDAVDLIMELLDTDLHRVIRSPQELTDMHLKRFMYQLLRGLGYAHAHGVIHRDLKPANLLLLKNCDLRISDFGLARQMPTSVSSPPPPDGGPVIARQMSEHVVTRWYRAPELMLFPDGRYTEAIDLWSVGCIFGELIGRKPLFVGANVKETIRNIITVLGTRPPADLAFQDDAESFMLPPGEAAAAATATAVAAADPLPGHVFCGGIEHREGEPWVTLFPDASDEARDLLDKLLQWTPERRISVSAALEHPFFEDVRGKYTEEELPPLPTGEGGFEFSFEDHAVDAAGFRELILKEVAGLQRDAAATGGAGH